MSEDDKEYAISDEMKEFMESQGILGKTFKLLLDEIIALQERVDKLEKVAQLLAKHRLVSEHG